MTKRTPALSTQLKAAREQIEKLQKELDSSKSSRDLYYKRMNDADAEIEQVHTWLDTLPGTPGRQTSAENDYQRKNLGMMTRIASYLSQRGN
jgi:septal ring factor EnvC (AmiA/AmiB activator)